jgi:predicted ATP-grasp superfamily ATP-dependent carboligase
VKTQNKLPYAIVIGIDCITGLQSARILAKNGVPVIGLAKDPKNFCCKTKVCEKILQVNTASEDLILLLESLGTTLEQKAVLFPCTDMSVLTISRNRRRLTDRYYIALPEPEVVEMLMDKVNFFTYAQQNDLPIPKTFFLRNRVDAEAAAKQISFPCILKPPIKTPTWEKNTKAKVYKVNDQKEFFVMYDQCADWADLLMVQEWIDGKDADLYSCNCYFNASSEPLVTFIARKLRQWPPETGTSCLGEECRNDVVLETSIRLFQSVKYHGLGYLEMKRDQRTGQHFIIEPNIGRPTGRSAIAEAGGVELLYTKFCDLANLPLPANREQKYEGVKWIYFMHDIQSSFYYWRRGELTLRDWWQSIRGSKKFAVLSWNDPAPFWYHFWGAFLLVVKAQISRLVRNREASSAGFAPTTGENS